MCYFLTVVTFESLGGRVTLSAAVSLTGRAATGSGRIYGG